MSHHADDHAAEAVSRPKSPGWDRALRKPKLQLPPGACDTHLHFLGPQQQFPFRPNHIFSHLEFDDVTIEDWLEMQRVLGLSRGLHVLSMMYENSYEPLLHSLCRLPDRLRGVMMPWPQITDRELEILTSAGVVGARFTRLQAQIDTTLAARVHEHGWSLHYLLRDAPWRDQVLRLPGKFVIEHTGSIPPERGFDSDEFRFLLKCLDTGRCWVKLSPRPSQQKTLPFSDMVPLIHKLIEYAPTRMLWGSDWPHPQYFKPMPNDADLVDLLLDWAPDEAIRKRILVDNPAEVFGFPPEV